MATMFGLEVLARRQYGLIGRRQALEAGVTESALDWRVADGSLEAIYRGVYRFRGAAPSWEQEALALAMWGGGGCAISHHAAAYLHGLDGFVKPFVTDLTVPHGRKMVEPAQTRVHRSRPPFRPFRKSGGIPVTPLARTLIDLAGTVSKPDLEQALHAAWRRKKEIGSWIRDSVSKLSLTRQQLGGVPDLMELVVRLSGGGLDSALEVRVTRALVQVGLPAFELRHVVRDAHGYVIRLDVAWPGQKVALHIDGYAFHFQKHAMVRDAEQRSRLTVLGWRQLTVMADTLKDGRWIERLRQLLGGR